RNQVVAPLKLVLDLRPLRLDRLFLADEPVIRAARQRHRGEQQHDRTRRGSTCHVHVQSFVMHSSYLLEKCKRHQLAPPPPPPLDPPPKPPNPPPNPPPPPEPPPPQPPPKGPTPLDQPLHG